MDVIWEWNGVLEAVGLDDLTGEFNVCLNVTRLGKHEIMIRLPWMQEVGSVLKLVKGGSYVLLGSLTLISAIVIDQEHCNIIDCKQKLQIKISPSFTSNPTALDPVIFSINNVTILPQTSQTLPQISQTPFESMISQNRHLPDLTDLFNKHLPVFSPQEYVLPPHPSFDIAIEIKTSCEAPFVDYIILRWMNRSNWKNI